jgi:hypothetical protein
MAVEQVIEEMKGNHGDFYDQVAGEAAERLHKMYGESLSTRDVLFVIERLEGFALTLNGK